MTNPKPKPNIRSIRWVHDGDIVTCIVGELITVETPRYRRRERDYTKPSRHKTDSGRVIRITDNGAVFHVFHTPEGHPSGFETPFFYAGKHATERVEHDDGSVEEPPLRD